jgi:hypothetical protein
MLVGGYEDLPDGAWQGFGKNFPWQEFLCRAYARLKCAQPLWPILTID